MCRTFAGQRPIPLAARILFSHTLLIPYFFHDVRDTIPTIPIPILIPIPFETRPHCSLGSETAFHRIASHRIPRETGGYTAGGVGVICIQFPPTPAALIEILSIDGRVV
jgi:hypothetical protein